MKSNSLIVYHSRLLLFALVDRPRGRAAYWLLNNVCVPHIFYMYPWALQSLSLHMCLLSPPRETSTLRTLEKQGFHYTGGSVV